MNEVQGIFLGRSRAGDQGPKIGRDAEKDTSGSHGSGFQKQGNGFDGYELYFARGEMRRWSPGFSRNFRLKPGLQQGRFCEQYNEKSLRQAVCRFIPPRWACPSGAEDCQLETPPCLPSFAVFFSTFPPPITCRRCSPRTGRRKSGKKRRTAFEGRPVVVNPAALRWGKPSGAQECVLD